jgi:GT2 family glycosyltransferase
MHASGLHKRFRTAGLFAQPQLGEQVDVGWVCGACVAVRREQFCSLGGFDEAFFVYAEDIAFGRRVRAAGLRSVLRDDVVVPHGAGSSGAPSLETLRLPQNMTAFRERDRCLSASPLHSILQSPIKLPDYPIIRLPNVSCRP